MREIATKLTDVSKLTKDTHQDITDRLLFNNISFDSLLVSSSGIGYAWQEHRIQQTGNQTA